MSSSECDSDEGLSSESDSDQSSHLPAQGQTTIINESPSKTKANGSHLKQESLPTNGQKPRPKAPVLGHTMSLPINNPDGMSPDKQRGSGSIDKPDDQKKAAGGGAFNPFGAIGRAVGGGVNMVGNATKAVGTGMVKGTQAVGSGIVSTAGTVKDGVVKTGETVQSGVKSGVDAVGTGVAAVGSGVVKTGEAVGSAAVSGVNAVGEATKRTATTVSRSVDDSTVWVREKRRSVILHAKPYKQHRVAEGETLGILAAKYKTTIEDILSLNKETMEEIRDLTAGESIKVPVRERRKSSRRDNSENFMSNLSKAFQENTDTEMEQTESKCLVLANHNLGPTNLTPGYLIIESSSLILTWGKDNPVHVEQDNIQGLSLLYGEEEIPGFKNSFTGNSTQVIGSSVPENEVFPTWDEQPELEENSMNREFSESRNTIKTEDSDELSNQDISNQESLKNLSFEDSFPIGEEIRKMSTETSDHKLSKSLDSNEDVMFTERKRSRKRTMSKDRRLSMLYEDSMATYLIIKLNKERKEESEVKFEVNPDAWPILSQQTPEYLLRVPNENVVRLFGILSRNLSQKYGEAVLDDMTGMKLITMDSLMSGKGELKVAKVLAQKTESFDEGLPDMSDQSQVLESADINSIIPHLPPRVVNQSWNLAFSTSRDGFSLSQLYRKLEVIESPVLLAIQDTDRNVFGSLLTEPPQVTETFTGTGESWLFSIPACGGEVEIYNWSKKNELFCKGCSNSLAIGAGDGQFGIWFDDNLNHGRSQACQTFDNPPLTPAQDFRVQVVECWSFITIE